MRLALALFLLLASLTATADELPCGTSPEHTEWLRGVGEWSAARAREVAATKMTATAMRRGDIFVLPADDTNAPFRRPFDLAGRTLIFERRGGDRFSVSNVPLLWHREFGLRIALDHVEGESHAVVPLYFDFPFFDQMYNTIYVTGHHALYLTPPRSSQLRQYGEAELATEPQPVIAPLLSTARSRLGPVPEVYVKWGGGSIDVTWASNEYMLRASLLSDGQIWFSYHTVTRTPAAGAILITSGREPWRSRQTPVAARTDAAGDFGTGGLPASLAAMLDVTNVSLVRVDDRDLYEIRIRTRAPFDRNQIPADEAVYFDARLGDHILRYSVSGSSRERYFLPAWGWNDSSSAVRVEGDELVLAFIRDHISTPSSLPLTVWTYRNGSRLDTTEAVTVSMPEPQKHVRTDFSAISEAVLDGPIAEAFTTPVLSVYRVWDQLKAADPELDDQSIDGVAIYQNFYTDIVTYAGAYSTGGNAGVSGLFEGDDRWVNESRIPALMHMNAIGHGHNSTPHRASRVILHELGHRWLMFVSLLENGLRTRKLNPVSPHPAQYVDTRAAFKVFTDSDTSVMGGGYFTDYGNGLFSTAAYGPYGYSWLDLYLMGLAAPAEVPDMFYVDDSYPRLGDEYYAPPDTTVRGTRRDFSVQQIIDATGVRHPAFPATQRHFRVVFVLLADPEREPPREDLQSVDDYRRLLERDFPIATGGRGDVVTALTPPPPAPRRRAGPK